MNKQIINTLTIFITIISNHRARDLLQNQQQMMERQQELYSRAKFASPAAFVGYVRSLQQVERFKDSSSSISFKENKRKKKKLFL
jgi:hypothetical protein